MRVGWLTVLIPFVATVSASAVEPSGISVIPRPLKVDVHEGKFTITPQTTRLNRNCNPKMA